VDVFASEALADPYPLYRELRAAGPVVHLPERDLWVATTYDAVRDVLRRPDQFVSGLGVEYHRIEPGALRGPLIDSDPPSHTRVRRSVQRWFTPSAIEARRDEVRAMVEALVDDWLGDGSPDIVKALARPLPVRVMGLILGIDGPDVDTVATWMDALFHTMGPQPAPEHAQRIGELLAWLLPALPNLPEGSVGKAIMEGGDDVMENVGVVASIWSAGIDTSINLISTALHTFATAPDEWDRLQDPAAAVEESLRHRSPIRFFMRRSSTETSVLGTSIPADADVCVLYACANRDERHYPDPDRFDVRRNPTDHLAFGSGIHLCLGAPLLRLEVSELFACLRRRVRRFELMGDPVPNPSAVIQGYLEVPLRAASA
jgi:cytochrome P450